MQKSEKSQRSMEMDCEEPKAGSKSQYLKKSIQQRTDLYRTVKQILTSVLSKLATATVSSVPGQEEQLDKKVGSHTWDRN